MAMNTLALAAATAIAAAAMASPAEAIEEAEYTVVEEDGDIELRDYEPRILVETEVAGSFEEAGNSAFRRLFRYISGDNRQQATIEMTAPVTQEAESVEIPMTAPVTQEAGPEGWRVAFLLPASYTWETAPQPTDERVSLRQVPAQRMAAIRFSGTWGESRFAEREGRLRSFIAERDLEVAGPPEYARYNSPFTPWFLRRNEVLIPVLPTSDQ